MTMGNLDATGVTIEVDGGPMIAALMPHLVAALSTSPALRNALVAAISPGLIAQARQAAAAQARSTPPTRP